MKISQATLASHNCQVLVSTAMNFLGQNQSGYDGNDKSPASTSIRPWSSNLIYEATQTPSHRQSIKKHENKLIKSL
jgi:hypothetical protein